MVSKTVLRKEAGTIGLGCPVEMSQRSLSCHWLGRTGRPGGPDLRSLCGTLPFPGRFVELQPWLRSPLLIPVGAQH